MKVKTVKVFFSGVSFVLSDATCCMDTRLQLFFKYTNTFVAFKIPKCMVNNSNLCMFTLCLAIEISMNTISVRKDVDLFGKIEPQMLIITRPTLNRSGRLVCMQPF